MTTSTDPIVDRLFIRATVRELQPKPAITLPPTASVTEALRMLCDKQIGSVVLSDEQGIAGIFTERDVLLRIAEHDPGKLGAVSVGPLMTAGPRSAPAHISIARIVYEMATIGCRHMLLDSPNKVEVVSSTDVVDYLFRSVVRDRANEQATRRDSDTSAFLESSIGDKCRGGLLTLGPSETVEAAWRLMKQHRKGSVVVTDGRGHAIGIFSERDLVRSVLAAGHHPASLTIETVMSPRPRTLPRQSTWNLALELMSEKRFRHLPVVDDSEAVIGMISVRDCFDRLSQLIMTSL